MISGISSIQNINSLLSNVALITLASNPGYQQINSDGTLGPTFLFVIEGENKMELKTDITDHYVEDNTSIQDHAALPPIKVSVHGFIGELSQFAPVFSPIIQSVSNNLTSISAFAPSFSTTALNALNQASQAYSLAQSASNTANQAWSALNGLGIQNNQQAAFQWWSDARIQRLLFNIQTPWCILKNCMPESIIPVQDESTVSMTDFWVTFKEIRFAQTITTPQPVYAGRAAQAVSATSNLGTSTPKQSARFSDVLNQALGFN